MCSAGVFSDCSNLSGVHFEGNAPEAFSGTFDGTDALVFYLVGTTGWSTEWGGRPTAVWPPQVQTSDVTFGVQTNRFGFTIFWASDKVVVVEATTNLSNPAWSPVSTNTLAGGTSYFSDPGWAAPRRFYRVRVQ